jgi:hypothetical protein
VRDDHVGADVPLTDTRYHQIAAGSLRQLS